MSSPIKAALLGASGYTGADLLRLGVRHPGVEFVALTANTHAGKPMSSVFPHLSSAGLPDLVANEDVDWSGIEVVFSGLPHGQSQKTIAEVAASHPDIRFIDMGADYRLRDPSLYEKTYGAAHVAPDLQKEAAYGLTELNREAIKSARIVACPGCFPTATLLALQPLMAAGAIATTGLIVVALTGVSGSGRGLKQGSLFSEVGEAAAVYGVGKHRHAPEMEQELSNAAGADLKINFTPHLVPMSRGEFITAHVELGSAKNAADLRAVFEEIYANEPFIDLAPVGEMPSTAYVRGSNRALLNTFDDRIPGRAVVVAAIDNLVKGSAGQAIQNFNIAFGFEETTALEQMPLFP